MTDTSTPPAGADAEDRLNPLRDPRDRRLPLIAGPSSMVMFGVTGDLARKKLLPAIYDLTHRGLLPPSFGLVGFGRRDWSDDDFADYVRTSVSEHSRTGFSESVFEQLRGGLRFVTGTFDDSAAFEKLTEVVGELDRTRGTGGNHAFYLSIPPDAFPKVCGQLAESGLNTPRDGSWRRVVIEKPFGHDLASARELNDVVEKVFRPEDVFRIDHYLGKETVQNILALRFANQLYEPVWNAGYVDHVQITMAEDIGIGSRAGYYDGIGTARDVIQNHLLQLLALTAMEEPVSFRASDLRAEKEKVLSAIELPEDLGEHTARGQYVGGWQGGEEVRPYMEEDGIPADSTTETFAAMRLDIATRRWAGVPFYLRAGKRLGRRVTEIALVFKRAVPALPLHRHGGSGSERDRHPGPARRGRDHPLRLQGARDADGGAGRDHGLRLWHELHRGVAGGLRASDPGHALLGDPPLFPRQKEVELSWKILDPITDYWAEHMKPAPYRPGTWGPDTAHEMLARDGRTWRRP